MKTIVLNKDLNYSLYNIENYKKEFTCEIDVITEKYNELLIEYFRFITENIKIKNESLTKFIILRGVDTITHVFLNILFYTKQIDLTFFHCQKSFYFYVEFVSQISEDEKMFLQLTSKDATIYVYKKTIFEINNECKKINNELSNATKEKIEIINSYVHVYKIYLHKIINNTETKNTNYYIEIFQKISNKLNSLNNQNKHKIKTFEKIVDRLSNNITNTELFFNINLEIVKKFIKTPYILDKSEKKIIDEDFECKINEKPDKFICWFLS
jgi:hypothetical protein